MTKQTFATADLTAVQLQIEEHGTVSLTIDGNLFARVDGWGRDSGGHPGRAPRVECLPIGTVGADAAATIGAGLMAAAGIARSMKNLGPSFTAAEQLVEENADSFFDTAGRLWVTVSEAALKRAA